MVLTKMSYTKRQKSICLTFSPHCSYQKKVILVLLSSRDTFLTYNDYTFQQKIPQLMYQKVVLRPDVPPL